MTEHLPAGVELHGVPDGCEDVLDASALEFVARLERRFRPQRDDLLARRRMRQNDIDEGANFDFLEETSHIRNDNTWSVVPPAPGLADRRVEITGPTDRRMTINALNSGAWVWMADFEDANSPIFSNMMSGQLNLLNVLDHKIDFTAPDGRRYEIGDRLPTIVVRPRGWHLPEKHVVVDGRPTVAALVDFGLYFFHCARRQVEAGFGPYFYLPKLESHLEARLWNEVFVHSEHELGLPLGTARATVLIETIAAAFEMEEILYELREHAAGLNAGRWDYLFSVIKKFRSRGEAFLLPDRNSITMTAPFMHAYTELLVKTCHRRGAHAIGGMAAFVPSRRDPEVNARAMAKVREDKEREAAAGFDGSWVAHPDLVPLCTDVFDSVMGESPNQLDRARDDVEVDASQLLDIGSTPGEISEAGLRNNVSVALQYLASWLTGTGAAAIFNLMEDVATAEIARAQIWQWLRNDARLTDGSRVSRELVERSTAEEVEALASRYDSQALAAARGLFEEVALSEDFVEFLTLPGYDRLP